MTFQEKKSFYFGRNPQTEGCNSRQHRKKQKNAPKSYDFRAFELELLSRFELETSSLPRMRSTN